VNILYSTHTRPDYMPPIAVSARQIVVGPGYPTRIEDRVKSLNVASGRYDLASVVFSIPADQRPELTLILVDAFQDCLPENLAAVPGRKVLLAADTHHGEKPLQKMLAYARQEPFDRIALIHDPHHLHWFTEAAIAPTTYIPNLNVHHFPRAFSTHRKPHIAFVGQAGRFHARRRFLLEAIRNAGLPLAVQAVAAPAAAGIYGAAQVTFNCSLNGDLNMRVFEVMAAGGFLVTDRLSPQAGLDRLFRRGADYVDYENPDDLIAKLRYYLARPTECLKVARSGQAAYIANHRPGQRIRDLLDFMVGTHARSYSSDRRAEPGGDGFGANLEERVRLYEILQNFARQAELVSVVLDAGLGARCISDFVDLPRLKIQVTGPVEQLASIKESLVRLGAIDQVEFNAAPAACDILVMDGRTDPMSFETVRARFVLVTGSEHVAKTKAGLSAKGFKNVAERPMVFERSSHR
jgi:hypothetical protein